jgi:hypothetical protein
VVSFKTFFSVTIFTAFFISSITFGATYYSQGSVSPSELASWNTNPGGGGSSPANFTAGDIFIIQNGHAMSTSAAWTVSGAGAEVRIESGGSLVIAGSHAVNAPLFTINAGGTFEKTAAGQFGASGGTVRVYGTVKNTNGNNAIINTSATVIFESGSTYDHNRPPNANFIPVATWNINSTAIFRADGNANFNMNNIGQDFGNVIWDGTNQGTLTSTFNVDNMNILGNFTMTGSVGTIQLISNSWAISGNFTQTRDFIISGSGITRTVTVGGNYTIEGGTLNLAEANNAGCIGILQVTGNFSHGAGTTITETNTNVSGYGEIVFNGSGTQTYTSGGTVSDDVRFTVNSGSTLILGTNLLGNGSTGTFTLSSGATLGIGHTEGITSSGATGNIRVSGTRTYNTGANYIYNGAGVQVTGNGLPSTVASFTTSGSASVTTSSSLTVSNNVTLSGTSSLTTGNTFNVTGNLIIGNGTTLTNAGHTMTITGATTVGDGTSGNLVINNASNTKIFTGLVTIASNGTWNNSGNSAVSFRSGITNNGTFTAGSGVHTFGTNSQALNGAFAIPSVTVTGVTLTNNNTLTVSTALAGTGGLTNAGSGTLNLGGTTTITTLTASASGNTVDYNGGVQTVKATAYHHLTLSNSGAKTMTDVMTIAGDLIITGAATMTGNSEFTVTGIFTYSSSGTTTITTSPITINKFNQSDGEIIDEGNTFIVTGSGEDVWTKVGGTFSGTVEFVGENPQVSGDVENVNIEVGGSLICSGNVTVSGTMTLNTGNLDINGNVLTLNGDVNSTNGGKFVGSSSSDLIISSATTFTGSLTFDDQVSNGTKINNIQTGTDVTLGSFLEVMGDITIDAGNFSIGANQLKLRGALNLEGGNLIGSSGSRIQVLGSGDAMNIPAMDLGILIINRPDGVILDGAVNISSSIRLYQGVVENASNLNLGNNARIQVINGSFDSQPVFNNPRIDYLGSTERTTGNELPSFPSPVSKLSIDNPGGVILNSDIFVEKKLTINSGNLNINGRTIQLGTKKSVIEEGSESIITGTSGIITGETKLANVSSFNPWNIGLSFTITGDLKSSTVTRGFEPYMIGGNEGINRYYEFKPGAKRNNEGLNATLVFSYHDEELNGNDENTLQLYKRNSLSKPWILFEDQTLNTSNNTITVTGVDEIPVYITARGNPEGDNISSNDPGTENLILEEIPEDFSLSQNYPNPFNPVTTLKFAIPESDFVTVKVIDITGREIVELVNGTMNAGYHTVQFDGADLASGIYFYRITTGSGFEKVMKMSLVK